MMKINYVTDAKAMKMMEEVVTEHASEILVSLGFNADDAMMNKITISPEMNENNAYCEVMNVRSVFEFVSHYEKGSAKIFIYPATLFSTKKKNGQRIKLPFLRLFPKFIHKMMVHIIAHELRHYWQYESGEYAKNETTFLGVSFVPYHMRWCERDANEFAREYRKSIGLYKESKIEKLLGNKIALYTISIIVGAGIGQGIGLLIKHAVQTIKALMS